MWHYPALILLSPVLLAQGKHVRKTVPLLPEPSGKREGTHGQGQKLKLLIIGDSAAAGVGVQTQEQALSGWLVKELSQRYEVEWKLAAKTGYQSQDTLKMLRRMPKQSFDVVITSLGVNDVTGGVQIKQFVNTQAEIAELLKSKFKARQIILSGLPPMHKFPALPQPLRWALGWRAERLDQALKAFSNRTGDCHHLSSDYDLDPSHAASDGFHPGAQVYRVWGMSAASLIQELKS